MADLSITSINDLDSDDIAQAENFLKTFLAEEYPSMDLSEGRVLRDLLIRPAAIFHTLNNTNLDVERRSHSLQAINEDPALADDEIVDSVLSNFLITRSVGTKATGQITIIISSNLTTSVQQGTIFTANGLNYVTAQTFIGVTEADAVISSQQKLITLRSDGTYAFTIPVEAEAEGSAYQARRNTRFTMNPAPGNLIDTVAAEDFTGGTDTETNEELVGQLAGGVTPSVFSGRAQIDALIHDEVPETVAVSIVGFGDAEMLRDKHNLFEIAYGGKADIWAKTRALPESLSLVVEATLVDAATKLFQFNVGRDEAPGFYLIEGVFPEDAPENYGTLEITGETRSLDLSQDSNEFVPNVANIVEGAYSRYQTSIVQFKAPDVDVTGMTEGSSKVTFRVNILYLPDIKTLQEKAVDRNSRNPQADYLVRAPVPAFVALNLKVQYPASSEAPEASTIKQAIVDRVNGLGFETGQLPASIIHDAVHNVAGNNVIVVSPLDFFCQIRRPDGTIITIRDADGITVPNEPALGVTSRTTIFFLEMDSVDVAIEPIPALPV
jgi:uncharacterized phage protein gp47/JayE